MAFFRYVGFFQKEDTCSFALLLHTSFLLPAASICFAPAFHAASSEWALMASLLPCALIKAALSSSSSSSLPDLRPLSGSF